MKRILVVDDNLDVLQVIKTILELKEYEVQTLLNGDKIIEKIKKIQPDLILLDVYLAGHNGIDIYVDIKANPHFNHIPVVMMSAHSNLAAMLQNCKVDAFIQKPFELSNLLLVIEAQLAKVA